MSNKSKPIYSVRVGACQFSVWENETEKGPMHSITINKSYKQGDEWKTTTSFKGSDLASIEAGIRDVFEFLYKKSCVSTLGSKVEHSAEELKF